MKKIIAYFLMILVSFLLQTSFFTHFTLAGIVPNFLLILTVSIGLINGSGEGCLVGFFCGLLLDFTGIQYFGIYALTYAATGYIIGFINRLFYKEDITLPLILVALGDIFYGLFIYLTCFLIQGRVHFFYYLRRIILPEAVYTVIMAIVFYKVFSVLVQHIDTKGSENYIA